MSKPPAPPGTARAPAAYVPVPSRDTPARPRRARRTTGEVVDRLMEAAREEFERNGFAAARTAAIARRAGVTEALLFTHFGSKAKLFHDSIFTPLDRHFTDFCATHPLDEDDAAGMREGTRQYVDELQRFVGRHSRMLTSLLVEQIYSSGDVQALSKVQGLHDYFDRGSRAMARHAGSPRIDPQLLTRVSFATILACVLFGDWLFPPGLAGDAEIGDAISGFVLDGLNANTKAGGG